MQLQTRKAGPAYQRGKSVPASTPSDNKNEPLPERKRVLRGSGCACGGTCPRCSQEKPGQTKLAVSRPSDALEREADQVADRVLRMSSPGQDNNIASPANNINPPLSRAATQPTSPDPPATSVVHDVVHSPGAPLDSESRAFFEPRFGHSLQDVRLHADGRAQQASESINARAFTAGRDIAFGPGQYSPGSSSYRRLLAHELAHVLQQRIARPNAPPAAFSDRLQRGQVGIASPFVIQRTEGPGELENVPGATRTSIFVIAESKDAGVIRDPQKRFTPERGRKRIPAGTIVSPLDYKEESGRTYAWVDWSGGIDWVPLSDLLEFDESYATPLEEGKSRQRKLGDNGRHLDFKKDAAGTYISPEDTRALDDEEREGYRQNVESFLSTKALTANQRQLVDRAMRFVDDGSIETPERMEKIGLDADLLSRIKTFYRFLVHEDLITGNVVGKGLGISGARTPQTAHELSTKWMLSKANTGKQNVLAEPIKRIELAVLLIEINGNDGVTEWANADQIARLSEAWLGIRSAWADMEIATRGLDVKASSPKELWADPQVDAILEKHQLSEDYKQSFERQWNMWPMQTTSNFSDFLSLKKERTAPEMIRRHRFTLDGVVVEIRNHFSQEEQRPQNAPALEGYPRGARERYPNLLDVGMTEHLSGDAADIHFDYKFNYYDPIVDALALVFGLRRPVRSEYWHYEAVGQPLAGTWQPQERAAEEPVEE